MGLSLFFLKQGSPTKWCEK